MSLKSTANVMKRDKAREWTLKGESKTCILREQLLCMRHEINIIFNCHNNATRSIPLLFMFC
jgi:hypothetical protein